VTQYGVVIYGITDPTAPVYVQTLAALRANGMTVNGNRLYVATGGGLSVRDITDPSLVLRAGRVILYRVHSGHAPGVERG